MNNSVAEMLALCNNKDNNGGILGFLVLIILFGMLGGGNWGFGGSNAAAQGALTRAELNDGLNIAQLERNQGDLMRGQFGLQADMSQLRYDNAMGFANMQNAMQQGFCGTQKDVLENRYAMQMGFSNLSAQIAQCCCDLKTTMHGEGEATRALIRDTNEQALRDQIQALRDERTVLQNQLGRQAQSAALLAELQSKPCATVCC